MNNALIKKNTTAVWDVVVIGGGPAGMMAAGRAGERGRSVLLLEKNARVGKKLLLTGGGRCNVTNNKPDVRTMLARYNDGAKFLFSTFAQFAVPDTIRFFEAYQVPLKEENDGRLFPVSNTARSVCDALVAYMQKNNVQVHTNSTVMSIARDAVTGHFCVTLRTGESIMARACIVAAGGTSHPETGSTGECFAWLAALGHTIAENAYALVPIALNDAWVQTVAGVSLPECKVTVYGGGKKHSVHTGKLLFTHKGMSGPMVLNMSKTVGELLGQGAVSLTLDLAPQYDVGELRAQLQSLLTTQPNKLLKNVLGALIPEAIVGPLLTVAHVEGNTPNHSVRSVDRATLVASIKAVPLSVKGLLGADKAVASVGGVAPMEVDFRTMESRLVPGLYLVGDVLSIDRPSGGYSLQLCWSSGYVAGAHA